MKCLGVKYSGGEYSGMKYTEVEYNGVKTVEESISELSPFDGSTVK